MKFYDGLKILFMILCLTMTFTLDAQTKKRKGKPKPEVLFEVAGGYFSHSKSYSNFGNEFAGLKALSLGYAKIKNQRKTGFSVGVNLLSDEYQSGNALFDERRFYSALQYNRGFEVLNKNKTRLYFGGFTGAFIETARSKPLTSSAFPTKIVEFGINVGPHLELIQKINDNVSISLGSKIGLFEVSFARSRYENPSLPLRLQESNVLEFSLTERFNVNFGVSIKM
jgi:hypothetical protein